MPTFVRSALNPNGSWQSDAMDEAERYAQNRNDQWAQFNINRGDQRGQDDWRRDIALRQLGLQRDMWAGGRADAADDRRAAADRFDRNLGYMMGRDKIVDERTAARDAADIDWRNKYFDLTKSGIEQEREFRNLDLQDRRDARAQSKPLSDLQAQLAMAELQEVNRRQQTMSSAPGISYVPRTGEGRDAYDLILRGTGDPSQAAAAAKQTERRRSLEDATAEASTLGGDISRFSAKDVKVFGSDPTLEDRNDLIKRVEFVAQLYRNAGYSEPQVTAAVRELLTTSTKDYAGDVNAGNIEALLSRFGIK